MLMGLMLLALSNSSSGVLGADNAPASYFNMFDHSKPSRFWLSAQNNTIMQYHPPFRTLYTGSNSFQPHTETKTSVVSTLYAAYQFLPRVEGFFGVERFDGSGLSAGLGMAGLPDLDVVRNPALGGKFYFPRMGVHIVIPNATTQR
jgi:high affinity Mn2+ porin